MAFAVLSQATAFNPGADLWIVPQLEKSQWTAKLDWYLNFQICKASRHLTAHTAITVNDIVKEADLQAFYQPVSETAPLMIPSEELLPNKWVVVIPWSGNIESWNKKVLEVWKGLREPACRVFLPPGQTAGTFHQAWSALHNAQEFTLVLD